MEALVSMKEVKIMSIKIIKTSAQAKTEMEAKRKIHIKNSTCPECKNFPNFSLYHYEGGLFTKPVKVNTYKCDECGCEWEVRE